MIIQGIVLSVLGSSFLSISPAAQSEKEQNTPLHVDVFRKGDEGYHTFRIPALIVSPSGTLLAFAEGRKSSGRDDGDIDLVLRRSVDGGQTWKPLQVVYEEGGSDPITIGNPCPVVDQRTGRIWLPFCRNNEDVLITFSDNDGLTWAVPKSITSTVKREDWGWYATGPGIGIQLDDGSASGRLVIPCDHRERIDGRDVMFSHVFYSDDQGESWTLGGSADRHTDECQVVELSDHRLLLNMRNYWGKSGGREDRAGIRAISTSNDGGATWGPIQFDRTLIEPICQASLIRYGTPAEDKPTVLVFSNPASSTTRHRLTVRLSRDEGTSWPIKRILHEGPAAYSSLTQLPDDQLACLYECGTANPYEAIRFSRFSLQWLVQKSD